MEDLDGYDAVVPDAHSASPNRSPKTRWAELSADAPPRTVFAKTTKSHGGPAREDDAYVFQKVEGIWTLIGDRPARFAGRAVTRSSGCAAFCSPAFPGTGSAKASSPRMP